jgi:hypothetical protein
MNWAWEQQLAPSPKLVLMALADAADDSGECWPRLRTVAKKCCTSERTVQRVLKTFEAAQLITVTRRFAADGRQTSNGYRLSLKALPDKLSPSSRLRQGEGDTSVSGRVTGLRHPEGDMAVSPLEPPQNTPEDPLQQPPGRKTPQLVFPRALSTGDHTAIEALLHGIAEGAAQALLDELAGAMETPNTIKTTPIRWLRALAERMRRGQFVPTAGVHVAARRVADLSRRSERETCAATAHPSVPASPEQRAVALQRLAGIRSSLKKSKQPDHDQQRSDGS